MQERVTSADSSELNDLFTRSESEIIEALGGVVAACLLPNIALVTKLVERGVFSDADVPSVYGELIKTKDQSTIFEQVTRSIWVQLAKVKLTKVI